MYEGEDVVSGVAREIRRIRSKDAPVTLSQIGCTTIDGLVELGIDGGRNAAAPWAKALPTRAVVH